MTPMVCRRARLVAWCLLLLSLCGGCISFRATNQQPVSPWPLGSGVEGRSINIVVSGQMIVNGSERDFAPHFLELCRKETVKAYEESGLFGHVHVGMVNTELQADVQLVDTQAISVAWDVLTLLTFFLCPTTHTDTYVITTALKDRAGHLRGTWQKSQTLTTVYQLFLMFAFPSHWPHSVTKATIYDLNRLTLREAQSQGVL